MDGLAFAANWAQVLSLVVPLVLTFGGWVAKRWVETIIRDMNEKLDERTKPIQAHANGGWSLPDAIRILNKLDANMIKVQQDLAHLKGRFDNHIEEQ